ncbi:hypothetical protein E4U11_006247 [Claviceps purpurea]|nr:hypothetical protein E4U11_006247 [Claviceps purpurea]
MSNSPATSTTQTPENTLDDYEYICPIGYSYYANAGSLSPAFYQTLLDRCWRRSGTLLYRPNQKRSCCPHYTIRVDSGHFKPSRDQRQTVNRFTKFVSGDAYIKDAARLYPVSREEARKRDNEFSLVDRIHEPEYDRLRKPPQPAHSFVVTLEEDIFTEEKYQVFDNYQRVVHKDPLQDRTRQAFKRFLCNSPLRRGTLAQEGGGTMKLGSYHQCYRLDGVLVAIGVLDLLPTCVSSVYFLYHESFSKHSPGKLGALYEIALASEKGYQWWYPGFYIHNCAKMRYKLDYSPQSILDPESLCWDPLDSTVLRLLDQKRFVSLSMERRTAAGSDSGKQGSGGDNAKEETKRKSIDDLYRDNLSVEISNEDGEETQEDQTGSLFTSGMPGISSLSDMKQVDLGHIALKIYPEDSTLFKTSDLDTSWDTENMEDWTDFRSSVAELVAAIGPDAIEFLCIYVTRGS